MCVAFSVVSVLEWAAQRSSRDLALALLVARVVLADDHDVAIAADDAAVLTHGLDARGDFH